MLRIFKSGGYDRNAGEGYVRGLEVPGTDSVGMDALGGELAREAPGHLVDAAFRDLVGSDAEVL